LVGVGVASAKEVIVAVAKAITDAKKTIVSVPLTRNQSIPQRIESHIGASRVILRPASEGTGVVAGGATRVVLELAGLKNIFGKQLGADNPLNNSRATLAGLKDRLYVIFLMLQNIEVFHKISSLEKNSPIDFTYSAREIVNKISYSKRSNEEASC
jgi:ribosomal protein S5